MTITAHELAMKLLGIPDLGNKPIRFSAAIDPHDIAGTVEMQFGSINIEEDYIEVELEHFNPHGETEQYLAGMIHRLYFPGLPTTAIVVNWDNSREAYLLEVCRPTSAGIDLVETAWYGELDKVWGFWVFHLDTGQGGPQEATLTVPAAL